MFLLLLKNRKYKKGIRGENDKYANSLGDLYKWLKNTEYDKEELLNHMLKDSIITSKAKNFISSILKDNLNDIKITVE